jgi:hypothetical protein
VAAGSGLSSLNTSTPNSGAANGLHALDHQLGLLLRILLVVGAGAGGLERVDQQLEDEGMSKRRQASPTERTKRFWCSLTSRLASGR